MHVWTSLLHPGIPVLEKIVRTLVVYIFLFVGLRVGGKRELGQLNAFDLIVLLLLASTLQNAIIGSDTSLLGGLIGGVTLLAFNYIVIRFLYRHKKIDQVLEGDADALVRNGKVVEESLARELITRQAAARSSGPARRQSHDAAR